MESFIQGVITIIAMLVAGWVGYHLKIDGLNVYIYNKLKQWNFAPNHKYVFYVYNYFCIIGKYIKLNIKREIIVFILYNYFCIIDKYMK